MLFNEKGQRDYDGSVEEPHRELILCENCWMDVETEDYNYQTECCQECYDKDYYDPITAKKILAERLQK